MALADGMKDPVKVCPTCCVTPCRHRKRLPHRLALQFYRDFDALGRLSETPASQSSKSARRHALRFLGLLAFALENVFSQSISEVSVACIQAQWLTGDCVQLLDIGLEERSDLPLDGHGQLRHLHPEEVCELRFISLSFH
jgi:hypothetical protein